jgi:hypothetical protein
MISEVDIRDWEQVDFNKHLQNLNDSIEIEPEDNDINIAFNQLWFGYRELLTQLEQIRDRQIKAATKQIPALFKPLVDAVNRGE